MSKHRVVINHFHIFSLRNKIEILIDLKDKRALTLQCVVNSLHLSAYLYVWKAFSFEGHIVGTFLSLLVWASALRGEERREIGVNGIVCNYLKQG